MKGNKIFKGIALAIALILALSMLTPIVVHAEENTYGNAWVYDEANVVSAETEEYIRKLNEETFSSYKGKPQLAFIILNKLPYNIDDYKLDMFNEYGVGTAEENHGMLFIFAIEDREYAFEIGDGFEKGTILRKELSTDFITSTMKTHLRNEEYDVVVKQIAELLAQKMLDEENGVYAAKEIVAAAEAEKKAAEAAAAKAQREEAFQKFGIGFMIFAAIGTFCYAVFVCCKTLYVKSKRRRIIDAMCDRYYKQMQMLGDINDVRAQMIEHFSNTDPDDIEDCYLKTLYAYYVKNIETEFTNKFGIGGAGEYIHHWTTKNNLDAFEKCQFTSNDIIIMEVDDMREQKRRMQETNNLIVETFLKENDFRIQNREIVESLHLRFTAMRGVSDRQLTKSELESHFAKHLKTLTFKYEFDKFCEEHKGEIDSKYFDKDEFYKSVCKTPDYENFHYRRNYNSQWMMHFLMLHMMNNRKEAEARAKREQEARERRRREEEAHRQRVRMQNNNSSFGSGFGGGFSSGGGGFKGGW